MKKAVMIGGEKMSLTLQSHILVRAFKESEMKSIWEAYKNARIRAVYGNKPPTEEQIKMAQMRKSGVSMGEIARKFSVKWDRVHTAVKKVAVYEYLNG